MVGKAIWICENTAADHKAVYLGILSMEFECMGAVSNIAINDKFGLGANYTS